MRRCDIGGIRNGDCILIGILIAWKCEDKISSPSRGDKDERTRDSRSLLISGQDTSILRMDSSGMVKRFSRRNWFLLPLFLSLDFKFMNPLGPPFLLTPLVSFTPCTSYVWGDVPVNVDESSPCIGRRGYNLPLQATYSQKCQI